MRLCKRFFVVTLILFFDVSCDGKNDKRGRHLLTLLGFFKGYKFGNDPALNLPTNTYFVAPFIVVPSINQQQSVTFQAADNNENYQETGQNIQSIKNGELKEREDDGGIAVLYIENDRISVNKNSSHVQNLNKSTNFLPTGDNKTVILNSTELEQRASNTVNSTTNPIPTASATKNTTNLVEIVTPVSVREQKLPPISDKRWQNFNKFNDSILSDENETTIATDVQNITIPTITTTESVVNANLTVTTSNGGFYPNARYNNTMIDQLSITTNSNANEESPSQPLRDDRWTTFSPKNEILYSQKFGGFKPLAGLYYDGYLHRPLRKYNFNRQNNLF